MSPSELNFKSSVAVPIFKSHDPVSPPLSKVLDNGIEKKLKTNPNPNQLLESANVLGATSATLDVADAACLLTSSKVSVRLSLSFFPLGWLLPSLPVFCCYTRRPTGKGGVGKQGKTKQKQGK